MPETYESSLNDEQLDALVQYLVEGHVTDVVDTHHAEPHHAAPPRRGTDHLKRPGFIRAGLDDAALWAIGAGLVVFFRWLGGYEPTWDWLVITVVASLTAAPIGFLAGIGSFDYWVYYISGRPTREEDHSTAPTAGATTSRSTPTTR